MKGQFILYHLFFIFIMNDNLITRKIKYSINTLEESKVIFDIQRQYSNCLHFTYNRLFENNRLSTKELTALQKNLNNIELNSHLKNSAIYDAKALINKDNQHQIIFGGKKLFFDRFNNKISKDEFKLNRLSPIYSIGEANHKGNRLFEIIDENTILFKPCRNTHILLNLKTSKSCKKELLKLQELMNLKSIAVTISLDQNYIYITFDYNKIKNKQIVNSKIKSRIFSIDQNPNYLGWSVIQWYNENDYRIIDKGIISIKPLNDKQSNSHLSSTESIYFTNKRKYEICKMGQQLVKLANHYQCEIFSLEKLNMSSSDREKGRRFNKLCNNYWCRGILYSQLKKYTNYYNIYFIEVLANYSSFIGNLVYRNEQLPDMILASIEINRRGFEFYHQYIIKDKPQKKNIILPELEVVRCRISQSLEELGILQNFETLVELYYSIKKSKQKYRLLLEDLDTSRVSSKFYIKKQIVLYNFI